MAKKEHLDLLNRGVEEWNRWREKHPQVEPDLTGAQLSEVDLVCADLTDAKLNTADLSGADLTGAELFNANLRKAKLVGTDLIEADLQEADLREADLSQADLSEAHLVGANLGGADLSDAILNQADLGGANLGRATLRGSHLVGACLNWADLIAADLTGADLRFAELRASQLVYTNLTKANLENCWIHGISAWNLQLTGAIQSDLIVTAPGEPKITVDNLEVAQFIYLILHNERIRDVINTITSKVVLILGRFTPERKAVLDAMREHLRHRDLLPVVFDFEKPTSQTTLETVMTLASMARFVIADITDAKSVLQELTAIVPQRPSLPVQPLLLESQSEPGMFDFFKGFNSFLTTYTYQDIDSLVASLPDSVIAPAEAMADKLQLS